MLMNLASMTTLNLFKAAVQFAISMLMAVFVLPAQYGLVTFSLPIIQFIALITDMGLSSAIIRQRDLTASEAGGALSFSLMIGLAGSAGLVATARPIEAWAHLPGVAPVLVALAFAVFCTIAAGVPRAMLERQLRYQLVAVIELAAVLGALSVCVALVALGMGIWGLVGFHVVIQFSRATAFYWATRHRYQHNLRWREVGELVTFGGWVLGSNVVTFAARNAQSILIGAFLGAAAVGIYGLSYQFMILPLMALAWPASGVLLATLARIGEADPDGYARPVLAISHITAIITFPVMCYLTFGLAWPIGAFLNPHWRDTIPLVSVLAPLGALQALASYNGAVLIARGRSQAQFHVNLASSIALLAAFAGSLRFGLRAFVLAYLIVGALVALGQIWVKISGATIRVGQYLEAMAVPLLATGTGIAGVFAVGAHASGLLGWLEMSGIYAMGVLAVYVMRRKTIMVALRALLPDRLSAAAL